jgi:ABC-type spermidine/putrescine transport system permease subunit I
VGALAIGAIAVGALALGAVAIGRLVIGRARGLAWTAISDGAASKREWPAVSGGIPSAIPLVEYAIFSSRQERSREPCSFAFAN